VPIARRARLAAGTSAMKYKRTEIEQERKKRKSRNGKQSIHAIIANATNKDIQFHLCFWHRRCHTIKTFIPRIKWKEMQHNHGVG
jgi:hypothetical protein